MLGFAPTPQARAETLGAVTGSSRGTVLTANASANTKGTGVSLGTPAFPYQALAFNLHNANTAADYVVDLYLGDPASGGFALAADLRLPAVAGVNSGGLSYLLPLRVPSGTALYGRCACSTGSSTLAATVTGFSAGIGGTPGFGQCVSLYTPSSSAGAAWTSAGAGADSGYTQLTAGVTQRIVALMACLSCAITGSGVYWVMRVAAGAAGSEVPVMPGMHCDAFSAGIATPSLFGPIGCDLAPSTRLAVAGMTGQNAVNLDVALWGLVP